LGPNATDCEAATTAGAPYTNATYRATATSADAPYSSAATCEAATNEPTISGKKEVTGFTDAADESIASSHHFKTVASDVSKRS
jgi:hypothetical protein